LIIQATFVGAHGSLGYEYGKTYNLTFLMIYNKPVVVDTNCLENGTNICPYSSFDTFLANWANISKVVACGGCDRSYLDKLVNQFMVCRTGNDEDTRNKVKDSLTKKDK
jgi:hypothetical protein